MRLPSSFRRVIGALPYSCLLLFNLPSAWAEQDEFGMEIPAADNSAAASGDSFGFEDSGMAQPAAAPVYQHSISLGLFYLDDKSSMYGRYNDLDHQGLRLDGRIALEFAQDSSDWTLSGTQLGTNNRELAWDYANTSKLVASVSYTETSTHNNASGNTPFAGATTLTLPTVWQGGVTTGDFTTALIQRNVSNSLQRRRLEFFAKTSLQSSYWTSVGASLETKQGQKIQGSAIYFNAANPQAALLPKAVDQVSRTLAWQGGFESQTLLWTLAYQYLDFSHGQGPISWQNPYTSGLGGNVDYPNGSAMLALEPEYDQHQLRVAAAYRHSPALRLAVDAAITETRQTGALLPYTNNAALVVAAPLPVTTMEAPLVNSQLHLAAYTQPLTRLGVNFEYHFRDEDNQATQYAWQYVRGDGADQPSSDLAVFNLPRDETTSRYSVDAHLRLPDRSRLQWGYAYETVFRNFAAVTDTQQDEYAASYQFSLDNGLQNRLGVTHRIQRGSTYEWSRSFFQLLSVNLINQIAADQRWNNHPALRQFHLADSSRDQINWRSTWQMHDQWWLQLLLGSNRVRYTYSDLGLRDQQALNASVAASYMPSNDLTLQWHLDLRRDKRDQRGRTFAGGINKPANVVVAPLPQGSDPRRNYDVLAQSDAASLGFDLNWTLSEQLQLAGHYTYLRANSSYEFRADQWQNSQASTNTLPALGSPLPNVISRLHSLEASVTYIYSARISLVAGYQYYRYQDNDYALANTRADSMTKVLGLGATNPNDALNLLSVTMTYQF